jgi:ABC-type metal ion transport system substrate-binding protein
MRKILVSYLQDAEIYVIDVDFLHSNEVDPYIRDVFIPIIRNEQINFKSIHFQTKSRERMKKMLRAFQSLLQMTGPIFEEDGRYKV